jgi:recombination protein RecT
MSYQATAQEIEIHSKSVNAANSFAALYSAKDEFSKIASAYGKLIFKSEAEFARQKIVDSFNTKPEKAAFALFNCTPESIYNAISQVSAIGLSLNPKLQHAYLIPRANTVSGKIECSLDFGYKGLIKLGLESGAITSCVADSVFSWDMPEWAWNGPTTEPTYGNINPFDTRRDTIMSVGVYCVSKLAGGDVQVIRMSRHELDAIRELNKYSKAYRDYREQMEFKSVIKRASKTWPMTSTDERLQAAVDSINQSDGKFLDIGGIENRNAIIEPAPVAMITRSAKATANLLQFKKQA